MVSRRKPVSADDLQDFIEGRLSQERRVEVEAYLQSHPAEARRVEALREQGILIGTDGPWHNVLKIRPPMPFNTDDADRLVEAIDVALAGIPTG